MQPFTIFGCGRERLIQFDGGQVFELHSEFSFEQQECVHQIFRNRYSRTHRFAFISNRGKV